MYKTIKIKGYEDRIKLITLYSFVKNNSIYCNNCNEEDYYEDERFEDYYDPDSFY